jgi:hypothetical protein
VSALEVVGSAELAAELGITQAAIAMRRKRGLLPIPDAVLRCGPIWRRSTIDRWQAHRVAVAAMVELDARQAEGLGQLTPPATIG